MLEVAEVSTVQPNIQAMYTESRNPSHVPIEQGRIRSLAELQQRVDRESLALKKRFADFPEHEVELVLDLFYGPLRLKHDTLATDRKPDIREKETSARIQHAFVHGIYTASEQGSDPAFTKTMYELVKAGQILRGNRLLQEYSNLPLVWKGIQNELAIIRALKQDGFDVILPDYEQDTMEIDDADNEVLQWDVRSGVDLIAKKDGQVFLIDAKGRLDIDEVDIDSHQIDPQAEWNTCLRSTLTDLTEKGATNFYRAVVRIPTAAVNFRRAQFPDAPSDPRAHLADFGRLQPFMEGALTREIANIAKYAKPISHKLG